MMQEFKVGDEVRVLKLALGYSGPYKKGDVGVIKVMDNGYFKLNGDENNGCGWIGKVELVQSKYPKFKIGDEVRRTLGGFGIGMMAGDESVILAVAADGALQFIDGNLVYG